MASQVQTVSQITYAIKNLIEGQFREVYIQGEVSNFRAQASGHLYFSLKDASSQISAVMFRGNASRLATKPTEGNQVIVRGEISVYPPRGNYQVIVRELHYVGAGELLLRLEALKKELAARGWFDPERKKPLPPFPKRIGVITSPSGAAIQDMLNILRRRHAGFRLLLNPVRVQGAEAAGEIAQAIEVMNAYQLVDVLIIGRGGGSIEDLWPFNEEIVAAAIFRSRIPIIAAIGHETDFTIADFVADVRAPTPSAAAELVIAEKSAQFDFLARAKQQLDQTMAHLTNTARHRLQRFQTHPLFSSPYQLLGRPMQRLDDLRCALDRQMRFALRHATLQLQGMRKQATAISPIERIRHYRHRAYTLTQTLDPLVRQLVARKHSALQRLAEHLSSVNPRNLVAKGYAILFSQKDQKVISSIRQVTQGEPLKATLADGEIDIEVTKVCAHDQAARDSVRTGI